MKSTVCGLNYQGRVRGALIFCRIVSMHVGREGQKSQVASNTRNSLRSLQGVAAAPCGV